MAYIKQENPASDFSKIKVPKCYEKYIYKAIGSSIKMLTLKEFIKVTEFSIHAENFDIIFMNINDEGVPIYIDEAMLNWMGYNGKSYTNKHRFRELVRGNFEEEIEYKILRDKEYENYIDEFKIKESGAFNRSNLPLPSLGITTRSKTHLIVMPDTFRSLCMMINTDKGKQIRKYYITLEKLIKAYNLYQTVFRENVSNNSMDYKDDEIYSLYKKIDEAKIECHKEHKKKNKEFKKANKIYKQQAREIKLLLAIILTQKEKLKNPSMPLTDLTQLLMNYIESSNI
jgi:phage anti-repressor protein